MSSSADLMSFLQKHLVKLQELKVSIKNYEEKQRMFSHFRKMTISHPRKIKQYK